MQCPTCHNQTLKPVKLAQGLPGYSCSACKGSLIELLSYRMWIEHKPVHVDSQPHEPEEIHDSQQAILCPKCSTIMSKYRISGDVGNRVDACGHCGEIWLDGGEWELLEQLDLSSKLPQILSMPWQLSIRKAELGDPVEQRFAELLGTDDYSRVKAFREWMQTHSRKADIREYLAR